MSATAASPLARLLAALILPLALAACATAPRALAPVPETLPDNPAHYPADAVFAATAILARIQNHATPHTAFSPQAAAALDERDFHFPGFTIAAHRLLQYTAATPGPGRQTTGSLVLQDEYGRIGALLYQADYHLEAGTLTLDKASANPVYRKNVSIQAMLVPKMDLAPLPDTWQQAYTTLFQQNAMPKEGLTTPHLLGTHALAIFVMERMHPETALNFNFPIPGVTTPLPKISLDPTTYHDYDGWRVAIITTSPGLTVSR